MKAHADRILREAEEKRKRIEKAVLKIQKVGRGMIGRKKYKKMLPALKKRLRDRIYCVECENKVATKRCKQCKDRFCNDCFAFVHRTGILFCLRSILLIGLFGTGNRREHKYETLRADAKLTNMLSNSSPVATRKTSDVAQSALTADAVNKNINLKDWVEYYDDNAKAKYWFNKETGEASWINPSLHK